VENRPDSQREKCDHALSGHQAGSKLIENWMLNIKQLRTHQDGRENAGHDSKAVKC
jgi:hypothetical protein